MHPARRERDADVVERHEPAELLGDVDRAQRGAGVACVRMPCNRSGCDDRRFEATKLRRDRNRLLLARAKLLVDLFQHTADPLGDEQHDQQQQQAIKEIAELRERRHHFRQRRQDHGPEQRAQDAAAPANDDADKEEHAQVEDERLWRNVALQRSEERARNACRHAAEDEHDELGPENGHADRLRRDRIVANRHQPPTPHAAREIPGQQRHERGDQQREVIEPRGRVEWRRVQRPHQADAAARQTNLRQDDLVDNERERHRGHREIEPRQPKRRQAKRQAAQTTKHPGHRGRCIGIEPPLADQNAKRVRTDRQQADVTDR